MYGTFGRLNNLEASIRYNFHFNTHGCAVKPTSCMRFSHVGHAARYNTNSQWIASLLSPTMNLDGKRGFGGEENVSSSKEPRKLLTHSLSLSASS